VRERIDSAVRVSRDRDRPRTRADDGRSVSSTSSTTHYYRTPPSRMGQNQNATNSVSVSSPNSSQSSNRRDNRDNDGDFAEDAAELISMKIQILVDDDDSSARKCTIVDSRGSTVSSSFRERQ
jgi:hypothetical protein